MRLQVKGKNVEVTESLHRYVEEKLSRLEKHLNEATQLEVELAVERNPSIADNQVAEATVWTKGPVLRARESSSDMRASIDLLSAKLERQVKRYRSKRRPRPERPADRHVDAAPTPADPAIVKTKRFAIKPMSSEEAALQLELVGHDFFVFRNDESDEVNVVYRRRDGNFGLIEPEQVG